MDDNTLYDAVKYGITPRAGIKNLQTGIKSIDPLENITYIASNNENAALKSRIHFISLTLVVYNLCKSSIKNKYHYWLFLRMAAQFFLAGNDEDYKNINIFLINW